MTGQGANTPSSLLPIRRHPPTISSRLSGFSGYLFAAAVAVVCRFSSAVPFWTGVAFVMVAYVSADILKNCSNEVKLIDFTLLLAGMQWFVLPHFTYLFSDSLEYTHLMQVGESEYMFNTLIAYLGYWIGMKLFAPKIVWQKNESRTSKTFWPIALRIGVLLFAIGFMFSSFIAQIGLWIAMCYLLKNICFASQKRRYIWALIALDVYVLIQSIVISMFHRLLLMLMMQLLFFTVIFKIQGKKLFVILLGGMMFINVLQVSKTGYRQIMGNYRTGERIEVFYKIFWDNMQNMFSPDDSGEQFWMRYNQGRLISHVYLFTDGKFRAENLSKFAEPLMAIALPRFLMPDKRRAGGKDNIKDFTNLKLADNTSMNISTVGEGYAYFGKYGNFIFHLMIGGIFAGVLRLLMHWERIYGVGVFGIPAIFSLSIRAESDFVTGYNALFKTLLLFALILWYSNSRVKTRGISEAHDEDSCNGSVGAANGTGDL